MDRTLLSATTLGQSGPESTGNEEVLHIPKSSTTGASPSDFLCHIQDTHWQGGVLPLCRDTVGIFYSPSLQD